MSAIPPKADMVHQGSDVRFVPEGDIAIATITQIKVAGRGGKRSCSIQCFPPLPDGVSFAPALGGSAEIGFLLLGGGLPLGGKAPEIGCLVPITRFGGGLPLDGGPAFFFMLHVPEPLVSPQTGLPSMHPPWAEFVPPSVQVWPLHVPVFVPVDTVTIEPSLHFALLVA